MATPLEQTARHGQKHYLSATMLASDKNQFRQREIALLFCEPVVKKSCENKTKTLVPFNNSGESSFFSPIDSVRVNFGVALIQILGVEEKSEIIKLKLWERHVSSILFI